MNMLMMIAVWEWRSPPCKVNEKPFVGDWWWYWFLIKQFIIYGLTSPSKSNWFAPGLPVKECLTTSQLEATHSPRRYSTGHEVVSSSGKQVGHLPTLKWVTSSLLINYPQARDGDEARQILLLTAPEGLEVIIFEAVPKTRRRSLNSKLCLKDKRVPVRGGKTSGGAVLDDHPTMINNHGPWSNLFTRHSGIYGLRCPLIVASDSEWFIS